jgi:hypothetical protein
MLGDCAITHIADGRAVWRVVFLPLPQCKARDSMNWWIVGCVGVSQLVGRDGRLDGGLVLENIISIPDWYNRPSKIYAVVKIDSLEIEKPCEIRGRLGVSLTLWSLIFHGNVENLLPLRWKQNYPPKCRLIFAKFHGVSSQTTIIPKRSSIFSMMGLQFTHKTGGKRNVGDWYLLSCITTLYHLHSYSASNYEYMHWQSHQKTFKGQVVNQSWPISGYYVGSLVKDRMEITNNLGQDSCLTCKGKVFPSTSLGGP